MDTARRTQTSRRWRMRHLRTLIVAATAATAALSVVALSATAQAAPNVTVATAKTVNVPAGVATAILSPACPSGNTASLSSSTPALPASVTAVAAKTKLKLVGVWPGAPSSYAVKVGCSGGSTISLTVKVQSAPPENSAVGLGADTQQYLVDQFSGDYNATISSSTASRLYNWDATNPVTGAIGDSITVKQTCTPFARPDGSSAGIKQLALFQQTSDKNFYCDSWANDARPRGSSDPPFAPGGVAFVALAGDAVTWATPKTNDAPATLTPAQLAAIYTCTDTNWSQVGGKNATIQPFLPQTGAGTLTFWLAAIGVTTPGPCVSNKNNTLEQNEGVDPVLQNPAAIWIYSIGDYISQKFHSAACTNSGCTSTPPCTPKAGKNEFGCDLHGTYILKEINGVAPTKGKNGGTTINPAFPATFDRLLYEVVPYDPNTSDHIPGATNPVGGVNLEKIFGASGWACTNATAKLDIKNYGFVSIPTCGATS